MAIKVMIERAKLLSFDVYAPENLSSYFYITDGTQIGYCQFNRLDGETFSTVHKPCKTNGTGFRVESMRESLGFAPHWATSIKDVKKYKNFAEFQRKHWQALIQY